MGSYQTANVSGWYNAQKHAHCYPGTTVGGTAGWFQWNIRDHSGARPAVFAPLSSMLRRCDDVWLWRSRVSVCN